MDALNLLFVNLREAITTWLAGFLPLWAADAVVHLLVGIVLVVMALMSVLALPLGEREEHRRVHDEAERPCGQLRQLAALGRLGDGHVVECRDPAVGGGHTADLEPIGPRRRHEHMAGARPGLGARLGAHQQARPRLPGLAAEPRGQDPGKAPCEPVGPDPRGERVAPVARDLKRLDVGARGEFRHRATRGELKLEVALHEPTVGVGAGLPGLVP